MRRSWRRRTCARPCGPGRPTSRLMAERLAHLEHDGHAGDAAYADLQHRFEVLGGYTLDQRVEAAL